MKSFFVYQVALTEAQRDELNGPNGGWDSKPEFSAYADMGMGSMGDVSADAKVREAAEFGLFQHVGNIYADDVTETFEIGNIGPEERIKRFEGRNMTSVSVGNVMVDSWSNEIWMCDNFGWVELSEETRRVLMANTVTTFSFGKVA